MSTSLDGTTALVTGRGLGQATAKAPTCLDVILPDRVREELLARCRDRLPQDLQVIDLVAAGTCGTCETVVLAGTSDHRDSILTDEERCDGQYMMICVSRSSSGLLVLDV